MRSVSSRTSSRHPRTLPLRYQESRKLALHSFITKKASNTHSPSTLASARHCRFPKTESLPPFQRIMETTVKSQLIRLCVFLVSFVRPLSLSSILSKRCCCQWTLYVQYTSMARTFAALLQIVQQRGGSKEKSMMVIRNTSTRYWPKARRNRYFDHKWYLATSSRWWRKQQISRMIDLLKAHQPYLN